MESLSKEHEKVWKTSRTSKTLDHTQEIVDQLQRARDAIAADPATAPLTLAKLQNPVKTAFDNINSSLKEIYGGHNKYTRVLDKLFKDKPLPTTEIDALSQQPTLINRAIYLHLLREGLFDVARTFHEEISTKFKEQSKDAAPMSLDNPSDHSLGSLSSNMESQFEKMYSILHELESSHDLAPAIAWAREHSTALEARGSNLEFELCRLQYITHFFSDAVTGPQSALAYARAEFPAFHPRYAYEIQHLLGAIAFSANLGESPYHTSFSPQMSFQAISQSFTLDFCSLLSLSSTSPLYLTVTAGSLALPTLAKLSSIMAQSRAEWTTTAELPVEIPLPPKYLFHSIFVCPVSKEQCTDANPPMMMPCGHVVSKESLLRLSKGGGVGRFKCPYCPGESTGREAKRVYI